MPALLREALTSNKTRLDRQIATSSVARYEKRSRRPFPLVDWRTRSAPFAMRWELLKRSKVRHPSYLEFV